ncbi:hypothetical protein L3X38_011656 [Prunus dulcis]|uniref:RecA family profile 1 domain-containing protein n=1 Tax=Prunus dulcis TaxID=3755 RepID=A0AAD4ZF98_PRUDU|nr:hypothetical protein L3X38_011656 [Prunus dulcis]
MHLLHINGMKAKIEIAPATAIMVFKESDEMPQLKQQEVETEFELFQLVGESGSGKTQLCLQLTVRAQLPPSHGGLGGSFLYIFTEFSFSCHRLQQLGNLYHASYPNLIGMEPLEDIYVHGVHDAQQLIHVLRDIQAFIAIDHTRLPVKLIVIDSIAALFRSQYQTTPADLKRRSKMFFKISRTLKALANKFGLAVVVTNQVVDFIGPHMME